MQATLMPQKAFDLTRLTDFASLLGEEVQQSTAHTGKEEEWSKGSRAHFVLQITSESLFIYDFGGVTPLRVLLLRGLNEGRAPHKLPFPEGKV